MTATRYGYYFRLLYYNYFKLQELITNVTLLLGDHERTGACGIPHLWFYFIFPAYLRVPTCIMAFTFCKPSPGDPFI